MWQKFLRWFLSPTFQAGMNTDSTGRTQQFWYHEDDGLLHDEEGYFWTLQGVKIADPKVKLVKLRKGKR